MERYHRLDKLFDYRSINNQNVVCPLDGEYSCLHLLYPGRAMLRNDDYNPYSIPHEDPEAARKAFIERTRETREYAAGLERRVRSDGGGDAAKVNIVTSEDPSIVNDDPDLKFANMMDPMMVNNAFPLREQPAVGPSPMYEAKKQHSEIIAPQPLPFIDPSPDPVIERFDGSGSPSLTDSPRPAPLPQPIHSSSTFPPYMIVAILGALLLMILICVFLVSN